MRLALTVLLCFSVMFAACTNQQSASAHAPGYSLRHENVEWVLDSLHDAASKADEDRYFSLFARDGIFLGTDDAERWTVEQFRAYAHPYFSKGQGWAYTVAERFVYFSDDGKTAWFDERLDNVKWGRCRGSGVLVKRGREWKIAQYNLLVPIPNDLLPEVAGRIREFEAKAGK